MDVRPGERVDDLGRAGLRIIQHPGRFPFAIDAVILAHFATVKPRQSVLDLGTGGGVIPLLLSALHPDVHITGLELQPETADMARRTVTLNQLESRIHIDCGDYREAMAIYGYGAFDVVTLNPPYREAGRGRVSPQQGRAAARHELQGSLQHAVKAASGLVRFRGRVTMVFLAERLADLVTTLREHQLEPKRIQLVHPRARRPANLVLIEAVKGGGVGLTVLEPLFVYGEDQQFSAEMQRIYGV